MTICDSLAAFSMISNDSFDPTRGFTWSDASFLTRSSSPRIRAVILKFEALGC